MLEGSEITWHLSRPLPTTSRPMEAWSILPPRAREDALHMQDTAWVKVWRWHRQTETTPERKGAYGLGSWVSTQTGPGVGYLEPVPA